MDDHSKPVIFLLLLVAFAINVVSIITWDSSHITNDAIQYLSTAKNFLAGNGFSTDTLMYTPHFQGKFPAAQTVWPPGFPFAIALLIKAGLDAQTAVLTLNYIAHALTALIMWLLLQKMGVGRLFATICALAFYCMSLPWAYVSAGMTEPVFTALLLGALLFAPNPKHSALTVWILCGLIIAAAIYVRFSTVFFAASAGAGILLYLLLYERLKPAALIRPCARIALLASIPALAFGQLMYRTHTLIGTFDRYSGLKEPESLASTLKLWVSVFSEELGFSASELISSKIINGLFLLFILLVIVIVVWFLATRPRSSRNSLPENSEPYKSVVHFRVVSLVATTHMIVLVAYLSYASMTDTPLAIISRYTLQVYPGLYAVFCVILYTLFKRYSSGTTPASTKAYAVLKGLTISLSALYLLAQINSVPVTRTHYFAQSKSASELMTLPVSDNIVLKDFIKVCFDQNSQLNSIWSTHGQPIHLHTGIPTISHPDIYTKKPFSATELAGRTSDYGIGMFVFLDYPDLSDLQYKNYMRAVKEWIKKEGYVKLNLPDANFDNNRTAEIYASPQCSA